MPFKKTTTIDNAFVRRSIRGALHDHKNRNELDKVRGALNEFNVAVIAEIVTVVGSTIASFKENIANVETHEVTSAGNVDVAQPLCVEEANAAVAHMPEG